MRGEEKWRPDKIGTPEAAEIRRRRQEGPSRRSKTGAKDDHLAHSIPGRPTSDLGTHTD